MEPAIIVNNISKSFDMNKSIGLKNILMSKINNNQKSSKLLALDGISFSVNKGEMLGIIGLNGSGKTTLLRIISGIYHPDIGDIQINGVMAPLLQIGTGFHNEYVAKENIMMYGFLIGLTKLEIEQKIDSIIEFAELSDFTNMRLKHYSTGMRMKLAFSTAIQINPDILLVDEILSVGDAAFREKSLNAFLSFKRENKTILYTSHNSDKLSKLCDRVLLLHHGKVHSIGDPDTVLSNYKELLSQKN